MTHMQRLSVSHVLASQRLRIETLRLRSVCVHLRSNVMHNAWFAFRAREALGPNTCRTEAGPRVNYLHTMYVCMYVHMCIHTRHMYIDIVDRHRGDILTLSCGSAQASLSIIVATRNYIRTQVRTQSPIYLQIVIKEQQQQQQQQRLRKTPNLPIVHPITPFTVPSHTSYRPTCRPRPSHLHSLRHGRPRQGRSVLLRLRL